MNLRYYCLLIGLVGFVTSLEFYSSVAHLKQSINILQNLNVPKSLKNYIDVKEKQLNNTQSWVNTLKELSAESKDPNFDIEHPLNVFRFIRNHSLVYNQTLDFLFKQIDALEKNPLNLTKFENLLKKMPSKTDLEEIVNGIFRIQNVYDISAHTLANGHDYIGSPADLTAKQCHYIADRALTFRLYYRAREWINLAIDMVKNKDDITVPLDLLLEDASVIAFAAGNSKEALNITRELLELNPYDRTARKLHKQYELHYNASSESQIKEMEKLGLELPEKSPFVRQMDLLCQGKTEMMKREKGQKLEKNLVCMYQTNNNPVLLLQPGKLEEVTRSPYLVIYHDFLGTGVLESLKDNVRPRLNRSKLLEKGNLDSTNFRRISKSAALADQVLVNRLQLRIEALTSSTRRSLEVIQIANYGVAGRYLPHEDFFPADLVEQGKIKQRISTFMLYLSDVQSGGATVFPDLNEAVFPKAGKAVFWYNTFFNGKGDLRTKHLACPTAVGDKWILNQWIKQHGNEFTRPCTLNPAE